MEKTLRLGASVWTGCSAGWFALWVTYDLDRALLAAVGCAVMAVIFGRQAGRCRDE